MKRTNKQYKKILFNSSSPFHVYMFKKNDNIIDFHDKCIGLGNYAIVWLEYWHSKTLYCWSSGKIYKHDVTYRYSHTC